MKKTNPDDENEMELLGSTLPFDNLHLHKKYQKIRQRPFFENSFFKSHLTIINSLKTTTTKKLKK